MNDCPYQVLVVEENLLRSHSWTTQTEQWNDQFHLHIFEDLQAAAFSSASRPYDGMVIGIDLLHDSSSHLLSQALHFFSHLPIIIISNIDHQAIAGNSIKLGFQDFLVDGEYSLPQLRRSIIYAIERRKIFQQHRTSLQKARSLPESLQETEVLVTDLMATLQSPIQELVLAINQLSQPITLAENKYTPLLKQAKGHLQNKYTRFLFVQHCLLNIDKTVKPFILPLAIDQVFKNFTPTLNHLEAQVNLKVMLRLWHTSQNAFCEILYQLISNTIKFRSSHRGLKLQIRVKQLPNNMLKLSVADNGEGIDLRWDAGKIFQLFYQEHQRNPNHGDGAGLYITKYITDYFQGSVSVNSRINRGTIVSIYLPNTSSSVS